MLKKILSTIIFVLITVSLSFSAFAHSGRTHYNGGHRDNKNKSDLGYYHYQCDGYPPHLHSNGVCPYSSPQKTTVYQPVTDPKADNIYLNSVKYDMTVGETFTPIVVSNSSEATKYLSSNTTVASINLNTGYITALSAGTTQITAYNSNKNASYTLTVTKPKAYILYSNIKAKIDNVEIPSYNYNGKTYIKCSDLNNYGFDVNYSNQTGIISIKRNNTKNKSLIQCSNHMHGSHAFEVVESSLKVCNDSNISLNCINGDNFMFVLFSDLSCFGDINWNPQERTATLDLK